MVLKPRSLAVLLALSGSLTVHAQQPAPTYVDLTFEKGGCKLLFLNPKTKKLTNVKYQFPAGTKTTGYEATGQTVLGSKQPEKLKPFVIRHPKKKEFLFLVSGTCAFPQFVSTPPPEPEPVYAEDPPPPPPSNKPQNNWLVTAGTATFRSKPALIDPEGNAYPMDAVAFGGLLGVGWEHRGVYWGYSLEAQMIYAKTQGALDFDSGVALPEGLEYSAKNVSVLTGIFAPGFRFRPYAGEVGIGLQVPVAYTNAFWPAETGYSVTGGKGGFGVLLDLRWERSDWVLGQKFALFGGGGTIFKSYWAFELSRAF